MSLPIVRKDLSAETMSSDVTSSLSKEVAGQIAYELPIKIEGVDAPGRASAAGVERQGRVDGSDAG